jgi:hypothetical protein
MLTARYTIVQQDISDERIPQVQVIGAVRSGNARSVYDYRDPAQLDVFGSGVSEGRAGVDIWHGMFDWKAGFAQTLTAPLGTRKTEFGVIRNGIALRSTVTMGYGWGDRSKILAGINRDQSSQKAIDGVPQANSQKLNHSAFFTADAKIERQTMIRLTVSRSAAFGLNQNTSRNESVTVALMRSF